VSNQKAVLQPAPGGAEPVVAKHAAPPAKPAG
jgi:hypothetical protein